MSSTIRTILAGIGFLLFSLDLLEQGFAHSSKSMSNLLRTFTTTKRGSILTGSLTTAILQSSSVTSLITLALVGSGVLGLTQAIGVILGANIGTTLFDGIIGFIGISGGFGLDLKMVTLPCIAVGGIGMVFLKKRKSIFLVLFSFGLMIYSLELLKAGVADIKTQIDLTWILGMHYGLVFFFGVILTIIIQSSSATTLLAMTTLSEGILNFEECLAIVIGAYLGTCITIVIGAMGGSTIKKQVATSHVGFNLIFCAVVLILFKPIVYLLESLRIFVVDMKLTPQNQDVQLVSLFHVFAKAIGVILFYPFIDRFKATIEKLLPPSKKHLGLRIESWNNSLSLTIKQELLEEDIKDLRKKVIQHQLNSIKFPTDHDANEHQLLVSSASSLIKAITSLDELGTQYIHSKTDIVQHMLYALNDLEGVQHHLENLATSENPELKNYFEDIKNQYQELTHSNSGYEKQKTLLQKVKMQDNLILDAHSFSSEQITLLSSINHAFYQCCKNCLIARDLM